MHALLLCLSMLSASPDTFAAWVARPAGVSELPESTGTQLTDEELAVLAAAEPRLPFAEATVGMRSETGETWVGSPHGLQFLHRTALAGACSIRAAGYPATMCAVGTD